MDDFRRFFFRGLAALVPTLLTIAILVWAYRFLNDNVGSYITRALVGVCSTISPTPAPGWLDEDVDPLTYGTPIDEWNENGVRLTIEHKIIHHEILHSFNARVNPEVVATAQRERERALWEIAARKYRLHVLGFLIAIILVYFVGFFLASFIGRASWRVAESLLYRIPLIRPIYSNVKQVTDFLLSERQVGFSGVVAVQYPRKGIWALGLKTGSAVERIQQEVSEELVTVFIPSSPTPVTGYVIQVPKAEVIELNFTIDEALRFTISGGVIKPDAVLPSPQGRKESRESERAGREPDTHEP